MRARIFLFSVFLCLAASPASAQGILPNTFAGWTGSTKSGLTPPDVHAGDHAALFTMERQNAALAEFGFVGGEEGTYTRGTDTLVVKLYRMKDASGAYGEYTYLRTPEMVRADLAQHSAMMRGRVIVLVGNLVLDVSSTSLPRSKADLEQLVASAKSHAEEGIFPTLWERMPVNNVEHYTDHYFLGPSALYQFFPLAGGDWLGFSQGAEAEVAKYRVEGRELTLLIADFPTPQAAQEKLVELQQQFNVNNSKPVSGAPIGTEAGRTPIYAKRSLTLLAIVSGAQSEAEADILLKQVESGTEVTWNEPPFELTQPSIGTIIVGTIIGTGIICAFALIAGVAFGGFRLIVKRLLPDRVFDRSSQMQVLQLGLTSKPINAEDFYGLGSSPPK
jgi:hypothetical protein